MAKGPQFYAKFVDFQFAGGETLTISSQVATSTKGRGLYMITNLSASNWMWCRGDTGTSAAAADGATSIPIPPGAQIMVYVNAAARFAGTNSDKVNLSPVKAL